MFELLRTQKRLVNFDSSTGTQSHDAPMGPQSRNQVILDWIERQLR